MFPIIFLMGFPLVAGLAIAAAPDAETRGRWVRLSVALIALVSVLLALSSMGEAPRFFALGEGTQHGFDLAITAASLALALVLLYFCRRIRPREWYIPVLILLQTGLMLAVEFAAEHPEVEHALYVDSFSALMALIIGGVGGLICIHAIRYMQDYQAHAEGISDRRPAFFFMLFLFLGAMFGIVFANHLLWLFFFWEVTTLCSFWLISYSGTEEAVRNGFRALGLNLVGGVAFAGALVWLTMGPGLHTWELDRLVDAGSTLALIPAVLIAVAGLAKSAQLPFSSWLLGAMVAPTPISALLHSSTMVKAGVFLLVKLAPVFHGTFAGFSLSLIGGVTFLVTSLIAVNQRNAKLVLAYSTIANLGLIVMCAGIGTTATLWAAILLILFHAVAKALLFLGVGTTEHLIGSRDIEDMEGLVYRHPTMAAMLLVGVLGMFLAPFGMLLSKYTCFQAFLTVDVMPGAGVLLAAILAFGSAPTLFFWSKWMGKLVAVPRSAPSPEPKIPRDEWIALVSLTVVTYVACALFPLADLAFVQPYTQALVDSGLIPASADRIPWETIVLMSVMLAGLFTLPLAFWLRRPQYAEVSGYLSGANVSGGASFRGAMGLERQVESRSYYLQSFIHEVPLMRYALIGSALLVILMLGAGL
ncbi:NADH-quinone oxidoreductase subunit 5 family protein [Imhoffiella purpurea]|uniref:Energy-conserving hydrogenase (Ferredoxin), subunit A n=1 Tax=Imhoffiella purpurea TaxID=1249627 RepID=W9VB63_9GAMM|nr:proton-conducting transporter membrane subunit [Imhoffiella purpurea]EXJ16684.1 Energy-conserving hydrogenase (ferredoxin), subunit A [Imhoffiella purpurea]